MSEAQQHQGCQGRLPMAGGTGLFQEGERGCSTQLKPIFSQQSHLWWGLYHYLRPKYKGGQAQKYSYSLCPSCGSGEMPPRITGTRKNGPVGECGLQSKKRGDPTTSSLTLSAQARDVWGFPLEILHFHGKTEVWGRMVACCSSGVKGETLKEKVDVSDKQHLD